MGKVKKVQGCVSPAKGPLLPKSKAESKQSDHDGEETKMQVSIGKQAPDFEASAFDGDGFKNVKLSDYKGKWVFLCFYPGDFTFV